MFSSLKNKIKEETGSEVPPLPRPPGRRYQRGRLDSFNSMTSIDDLSLIEQKDAEIAALRLQCNDIEAKCDELTKKLDGATEEKDRLEKANALLEESVRVSQVQKDLICEEQDKIQNLQLEEISKLKNLVMFRDQEAVDRLQALKQTQQQLDQCRSELARLQELEPMLEDAKDELERFRHSTQLEKNNLTTTLAAVEEENRHLKSRIEIYEESRAILTTSADEKVKSLLQERKMLEQRLEEAHLHLSDIKSSWSGQNLALETQVSRLSRQVAEETTEKRKALQDRDDFHETIKRLEFEVEKCHDEIRQRDNKIKLLSEEIDDLSSTLRETRLENEEDVAFLRSKAEKSAEENEELKRRLNEAEVLLSEQGEAHGRTEAQLRGEMTTLNDRIRELTTRLTDEKAEKANVVLKNAEISQSEEILKQSLREEQDELAELTEKMTKLRTELKERDAREASLEEQIQQLQSILDGETDKLARIDQLSTELGEKNKTIKQLNQRLGDMKKTLQQEIKSNNNVSGGGSNHIQQQQQLSVPEKMPERLADGAVVMDEVNFKYLKHVVFKFLTSREVEARHLIKAVATLLHLSGDEERILHETLDWKSSWFGARLAPS
ncbi:golgin subfamily A member 1 [Phlebotomus argentipes]|uniref:golgin subfamily A member 1 n=1 Tax=Phlebotomus argentipes TaxID=94469 RepID=UPI0028937680|nr:golgin subfamily A member 1 [Phlebotomus argentipes]